MFYSICSVCACTSLIIVKLDPEITIFNCLSSQENLQDFGSLFHRLSLEPNKSVLIHLSPSRRPKLAKWMALSLNYQKSSGKLVIKTLYKCIWTRPPRNPPLKMVGPSHLKAPHSFHVFSMKSPSSTFQQSMKLKTLIHTLIFSHLCRIARALARAKSILIDVLKENHLMHMKKKKQKKIFGSIRLHYNWCSSHVMPVSTPVLDGFSTSQLYYDSTWNSIIPPECEDMAERQLSGYLHWLEEKKVHDNSTVQPDMNEIDKLADMFIANCHEKFRLEKQESYRRFQEMLARSM